jgi:hypothetical protein
LNVTAACQDRRLVPSDDASPRWQVKIRRPADGEEDSGDVDELSSGGVISEDRSDAYAKPEEPVDTDFKDTGLPDWLDPIYDYADPGEHVMAEMSAGADGYEPLVPRGLRKALTQQLDDSSARMQHIFARLCA